MLKKLVVYLKQYSNSVYLILNVIYVGYSNLWNAFYLQTQIVLLKHYKIILFESPYKSIVFIDVIHYYFDKNISGLRTEMNYLTFLTDLHIT